MDARCRRMRSDRRAVGVDECFGMLGCLLESVDGWMNGNSMSQWVDGSLDESKGGWKLGESMGGWKLDESVVECWKQWLIV